MMDVSVVHLAGFVCSWKFVIVICKLVRCAGIRVYSISITRPYRHVHNGHITYGVNNIKSVNK